MATKRTYRHSPVVEALCEVYCADLEWDSTVPGRLYNMLRDDFPNKQSLENLEAQISFSAADEPSVGMRRLAPIIQFSSSKGDRIIQIGQSHFVVNQLRPYVQFEKWQPTIYTTLEKYRELTKPKKIERIGLRYINRINIVGDDIQLKDYFTFYPQLPQTVVHKTKEFLTQIAVHDLMPGHTMLITLGTANSRNSGEYSFILDIYDRITGVRDLLEKDRLKEEIAAGHANIIDTFEGSITDMLRAIFDGEGRQ